MAKRDSDAARWGRRGLSNVESRRSCRDATPSPILALLKLALGRTFERLVSPVRANLFSKAGRPFRSVRCLLLGQMQGTAHELLDRCGGFRVEPSKLLVQFDGNGVHGISVWPGSGFAMPGFVQREPGQRHEFLRQMRDANSSSYSQADDFAQSSTFNPATRLNS